MVFSYLSLYIFTGNLTLFDKYNMETEVINVVEKPIDDFEKSTDFYPLPPFLAYTKSGEVEVN